MKTFKKILIFALALVCAIFVLSACSKKADVNESSITSVEVKGSGEKREVRIKASFTEEFVEEHKGEKIYLIAKDISGKAESYTPLDEVKVKSSVKFEIPFETNGKSHISTAFVCAIIEGEGDARQFTPVTDECYITNISELGESASRPSVSTVKGLATSDIGHATYLGADHILLTVRIDKILLEKYEQGAVSFISQGKTYYFDGDEVEYFDKTISEATQMGARVYLQFVLDKPDAESEKNEIECLYFPAASSKAELYMPNITDRTAEGYLSAMFGFFADRYSGEHGVAIDYIIGKNANSGGTYNNAGSAEETDKLYLALVRLAYNNLVSRVSNGQVYISLDNGWRASSNGALAYLNAFNNNAKATGDFNWGIALSYGSLASDTVWASSDEYSDSFTADSLTELSALLGTDDFKHQNDVRSVIISDLSLKRNDKSENNATRRAASYAYLYYATQKHSFVKALIYSSYADDTWGILTSAGEETSLSDMIAVCGSSRMGELSYMDALVGSKWTALKSDGGFDKVNIYYGAPTADKVKTSGAKRLFNFAEGKSFGFVPVGGADFASLSEYTDTEGNTGIYLYGDGNTQAWRVLYCGSAQKTEIHSSKYLGITLNTEYSGEKFVIMITGTEKKTKAPVTYCATAQATSDPAEYFFDISGFADKLSSGDISFAICTPTSAGQDAGAISVYKVSLYGASGSQVWKYILIAIVIIAVAVLLFVLVRVLDKTSKKKSKKSTHKKKPSSAKAKKPLESDDDKIKGAEEFDDEDEEYDLSDGESE